MGLERGPETASCIFPHQTGRHRIQRPVHVPIFRKRSYAPLALLFWILVAGIGLRAYWVIHRGTLVMGVGHARIAENLLNRGRYVGLFEGTGSLRLDGKGIMNYTIGERRNSGMSHAEATLGIGPNLSEDGPQLSPNYFIGTHHYSPSAHEVVTYWIKSARRNKAMLFDLLVSPVFGSVLAIASTALGLFGRPWDQRRAVCEAVLLGIVLAHLFLFLGLHVVLFRYVLPVMTVTLVWVSKGIDEVARWGVATARRVVSLRRSSPAWIDKGIRCVLIGALLLIMLWGLQWGSPLQDQGPSIGSLKEIGIWLAEHRPGPKRIITLHAQVPYYARGTMLLMPYAEGWLALQYIHQKRPDFIVLLEEDRLIAPYLQQWLDDGIPDRAATLIHRTNGMVIYAWHPPGQS